MRRSQSPFAFRKWVAPTLVLYASWLLAARAIAGGNATDSPQEGVPLKKALVILGGGRAECWARENAGAAILNYVRAGWVIEYLDVPTKAQVQAALMAVNSNLKAVWFDGHGGLTGNEPFVEVHGSGNAENITFANIALWLHWLPPGQLEEVILHSCHVGQDMEYLRTSFRHPAPGFVYAYSWYMINQWAFYWEVFAHRPKPVVAPRASLPNPVALPSTADCPVSCIGSECALGTCATIPPSAQPFVDQALVDFDEGIGQLLVGDEAAAWEELESAYGNLLDAANNGADIGYLLDQIQELLDGSPEQVELANDLGDKPVAASQDTVWLQDWAFESGANCTPQGWTTGGSGEWARMFQHITDNDKCNENTTCAWLWSDPQKIAYFPSMAFGPGSAILRNWLDDTILSPWVSLQSTPSANRTLLSFRIFPGNSFAQGRIALNWSVRSQLRLDNTDTSAPGDSFDYVSAWEHAQQWSTLSAFTWMTSLKDLSPHIPAEATSLQLQFRVMDWQYFTVPPPQTLNSGPGPYIDRVRIGRQVLAGPVISEGIDSRSQAQDAFATTQNSITPGEHFSPSNDRFGTCAFSSGTDLGALAPTSPNLITGDSITVVVTDTRRAGGITSVQWYGAITAGPHAGKAPPPYALGANGFFVVTPDSARMSSGAFLANTWAVDLDDTYFRGGDRLEYCWTATDAAGGFASMPAGLSGVPTSVAAARVAAGGLHEVSALPTINWDPSYLAAIAGSEHGAIDPTPSQIAASSQRNCILYVNQFDSRRRSGPLNGTAFMRTLNALGYSGSYDIYDVQGYGNVNNQLGGRARLAQLTGYRLIVHDTGRQVDFCMPDGSNPGMEKIDQAQFYRDWLANGVVSEAGIATLWLLGENVVASKAANALFTTECGIVSVVDNQALAVSPDVEGISNRTFSSGSVATFAGDRFSLAGNCPSLRAYDGYTAGGGATATHLYRLGTATGSAAIVMNSNNALKWNTIAMGFGWFDIRDRFNGAPGTPAQSLAAKILNALLGPCTESVDPTSIPIVDENAAPQATLLHPNVPNPFNPATTIRWDLAHTEHVALGVYDVSGRRVRTLVDRVVRAGRHSDVWAGLDDHGRPVAAGVYLIHLQTSTVSMTRKLIIVK